MHDKYCCFGIFVFNFFVFFFNCFLFSHFSFVLVFSIFFVLVLAFVNEFVIFLFFTIFVFVFVNENHTAVHTLSRKDMSTGPDRRENQEKDGWITKTVKFCVYHSQLL